MTWFFFVFISATWVGIILCAWFFYRSILRFETRFKNEREEVQRQIAQSFASVNQTLNHYAVLSQNAQSSIADRLEGASQLVGQVQNKLGQLDEANRRILEMGISLSGEVNSLQTILQAPKIRGGWGELLLGELLQQVLGPEQYELQFSFKNGERVDAIIRLAQGMIPVDSKFPLENFRRFLSATVESDKKTYRREFYRDVRRHIDQIADKYLVPDEGTLDFALMYIPAENIYYETIIRDEDLGDSKSLSEYAQMKKVIPVSPNTLYVYLTAIARGLQGLKIESHAKEILANLQRMSVDLSKFAEEFRVSGNHLKNAVASYDRAFQKLDRFQDKFSECDLMETVKADERVVLKTAVEKCSSPQLT